MEQLVDFPSTGQEVLGSGSFMGVEAVTSPSDFLVLLPELITVDPQVESFSQRPEYLLGSPNWKEKGDFFTRKLGFSAPVIQEGFEAVKEGFQVPAKGEDGQVLQGKVSSRESSEDEWRVPLAVAEQRGFSSLRRDFFGDCLGDPGECDGRRVDSGPSKRRRKN